MASPNSIQYSAIKEATAGTTPATPAFKRFAHVLGENLQLDSESITSPIIMPGGSSAGNVKAGYNIKGSLKTHLHRDAAMDFMLESACGGAFTSNVAKCGLTDIPLTIEKSFVEGSSTFYRQFKGCRVAKFSLSCDAAGIADASFDIVGMNDARDSAIITGATYAASSTSTKKLTGLDVSSVSIAGLTPVFSSLELAIESDRKALFALGSSAAIGVGTAGMRKVTLSLKVYRADWSAETALLNDTAVAVAFTIGSGTSGYTFTLPAATCSVPQDEEDGASMFVKLDFTGQYDTTAATDLSITRLT